MNDALSDALRRVPHAAEIRAALSHPRVIGALHHTLRDIGLRSAFAALRAEGQTVAEAVEALRGPHESGDGRRYYLSAERVRSIVYEKDVDRPDVSGEEPCESGGAG